MGHKAQIISDWFLEHDSEFTLLKWPPQSPDLNPIEHPENVVEWETHIIYIVCIYVCIYVYIYACDFLEMNVYIWNANLCSDIKGYK